MGKRKSSSQKIKMIKGSQKIQLIKEKSARNITFCKRKKGLVKKAMELSILCGKAIALYIFDKEKGKMISFNSTHEFDI